MNAAGSAKVMNLLDGVARYDGEHPNGVHNWHWDWPISAGPGKYRIRVTNWSGHCVGLGEPFTLVNPLRDLEYTLAPSIKTWSCVQNPQWMGPAPRQPTCKLVVGQATVGYTYFQFTDAADYTAWHGYLDRARLTFNFDRFKGKKVRVKEAMLHLVRKSNYNLNTNEASCAGKVYIVNGPWQDCWNIPTTFWKDLPHDQTEIDVNLTGMTSDWVKGTLANNGVLLTSSDETLHMAASICQSCYTAELKLKIVEEYSPGEPQP